jgi:hypothetical protein
MATENSIVAHSSFHFEDLQLSSKEFYATIEEQLKYYEYPNLRIKRVNFFENSVFSSFREYLCVQYKEHRFYICAAPFGRSYFISWWLKEQMSLWMVLLSYIPFIGARLVRNNTKKSFYQTDTENLFLESIKGVVNALVDKVKQEKGVRVVQN